MTPILVPGLVEEGPVAWPQRSPDLNHLDSYHMNSLVYEEKTTDALLHGILSIAERIQNTPDFLERIINSLL
jgi:hypothetical protein